MSKAQEQKDILREMVFEDGTVEERCERWTQVLSALSLTKGLWSELGYAYKGRELCEWIRAEASEMQIEEGGKCKHHNTHQKDERMLNLIKDRAWSVGISFHHAQEEYMAL